MTKTNLITLEDFILVRGISRPQLAAMARISEKTVDRWLSRPARLQKTKVRKVAQALSVDEDVVRASIANGQKARTESKRLRALRLVMALIESVDQSGVTDAGEANLIKKRLTRIHIAAKRVAEQLESAVQETAEARSSLVGTV